VIPKMMEVFCYTRIRLNLTDEQPEKEDIAYGTQFSMRLSLFLR